MTKLFSVLMVTILFLLLITGCSQVSTVTPPPSTVYVPASTVTVQPSTITVTQTIVSTVTISAITVTSKPQSTTPTTSTTANLSTSDASKLALVPSDLPVGWTLTGPGTSGQASLPLTSEFSEVFYGSSSGFLNGPLEIDINVFASINDSKNFYATQLTAAQSQYSTTNPNVGQEAFADQQVSGFQCYFTESNVVAVMSMSTASYGGSLAQMVSFAQLQDSKIVKLTK